MANLVGNRLVLTFNHGEWWLSFWLKPPSSDKPYLCGGIGKWRLGLGRDSLYVRLDWSLRKHLGLLSATIDIGKNRSKTFLRIG